MSVCPLCSRFTKLSKMPALFQIYQVFKDARFVPDLPSYQRCPLRSRFTKLPKMPALLVAALGYVRLLLAVLWLHLDLFFFGPRFGCTDVCRMTRARTSAPGDGVFTKWGCGQSGVGDEYILEAAAHNVGAVSPVRGTRGSGKNTLSWKRVGCCCCMLLFLKG